MNRIPTRVAVVGSRGFAKLDRVRAFVRSLSDGTVVVSGGAHGVDTAAVDAARDNGHETIVFPAEWDKHGRGAGFIRNKLIVANADIVVAFWDGVSRGTADTLTKARVAGLPVVIHYEDGSVGY